MADLPSREQNIANAIRMQKMSKPQPFLVKLFHAKNAKIRKELIVETELGKTPVLLYGSEGAYRKPLYVDLHGGGFVLGSPYMDERMNVEIARATGCLAASIDYTLAPGHPFPAALEQIDRVIHHFIERANEYGIDPERVAVGGHSAGGNLSAALCLKAKREGAARFACQILDYPPMDLASDPEKKPRPKGAIPPFIARMFNDCYVEAEKATDPLVSPAFAEAEELRGLPPALVILAGMDSLHDEGLRYAEKLEAAGVPVELADYPEAKHGFTMGKGRDRDNAVEKMIRFLSAHSR
jgi:acetyl esterase